MNDEDKNEAAACLVRAARYQSKMWEELRHAELILNQADGDHAEIEIESDELDGLDSIPAALSVIESKIVED